MKQTNRFDAAMNKFNILIKAAKLEGDFVGYRDLISIKTKALAGDILSIHNVLATIEILDSMEETA